MSSNTGPSTHETFSAYEMNQALALQKAQSRASLATGVSVAALGVALFASAIAVWSIVQNGNEAPAAPLAAYPSGQVAQHVQSAPQDPALALAPVQLPPPVFAQQPAPATAPVAQAPAALAPVAQAPAPQALPTQEPVAVAQAQPAPGAPTDASQIYLAAGADGEMYALDAMAQSWFRFDESGLPIPMAEADVPAEARMEAIRQRDSGINDLAPNPQVADQAAEQAQTALNSMNDDPRYPLVNELLRQPEVAAQFLQAVNRAAAIEVPGEFKGEHPIYVFYDPRCPFSRQAFAALDGKYDIRWLHTLALGGDGDDVTAFVLGDMGVERNGENQIVAAVMNEDADRQQRLRRIMQGEQAPEGGNMSEAHSFTVEENTGMMRQLYGQQSNMVGVPSIIVPRPDGTAIFLRGFDDQTVAIIDAAVRGQGGEQ